MNKTTVDLGTTLLEMRTDFNCTKDGNTLFTFYVNGFSIRSQLLHLPSKMEQLVDCLEIIAGVNLTPVERKGITDWVEARTAA